MGGRQPHGPRRGPGSAETRERILAVARDLAVEEGFSGFTVEKVAQRAGVSRMTVYYQFGSKQDLLEALFDHLALRGRIDRLGEAYRKSDPLDALAEFIVVFCGFWQSDRAGLRRLRAWRSLEPGVQGIMHERDTWRREGLEMLVRRIRKSYGVPVEAEPTDLIDVLQTLTSFESYDYLAAGGRSEAEVAALMNRAACAVLGVDGGRGASPSTGE